MSFKPRSQNSFNPWDTVGLISDFYYCITNLFDVIIIGQTGERPDTHRSRNNQFDGLKKHFPHPFDMYTEFNEKLWNGSVLITKEHFSSTLPSKGIKIDAASESNINKWHNSLNDTTACDILLGYLRGTTGFYWEEKVNEYKASTGVQKFTRKEDKEKINPTFKKAM